MTYPPHSVLAGEHDIRYLDTITTYNQNEPPGFDGTGASGQHPSSQQTSRERAGSVTMEFLLVLCFCAPFAFFLFLQLFGVELCIAHWLFPGYGGGLTALFKHGVHGMDGRADGLIACRLSNWTENEHWDGRVAVRCTLPRNGLGVCIWMDARMNIIG